MNKCYILSIDSFQNAFSMMDALKPFSFSFSAQNQNAIMEELEPEDLLFVYRKHPISGINCVMRVHSVDEKIILVKMVEVENIISLNNAEYENDYIVEIDRHLANQLLLELINPYMSITNNIAYNYQVKFIEWMQKQVKPVGDSDAGNPYSESTIRAYVASISECSIESNGISIPMFECNDEKKLREYVEKESTENSAVANSAVKKYIEFINTLTDENEYLRAANILKTHKDETGYTFSDASYEFEDITSEFAKKFHPGVLENLSDDELLKTLFYTTEKTNDSMCYWLEFNSKLRELAGSIAGGSSYKFGLFQSQESGIWITGSPNKPKELTESEALAVGKEIRDYLVKGARLIEGMDLSSLEAYEELDEKLNECIGRFASFGWVHKYFEIIYPDKFSVFHSFDWQRHILYAFGIKPSEKYYGRSGQLALIMKYSDFNACQFGEVFFDKYGTIKKFVRIGTTQDDQKLAEELRAHNAVGMGWNELGTLTEFASGKNIDKKSLAETMASKFYSDKPQVATRKAGEFVTFYAADTNTIFVPMDGERLLALADEVGDYYYDEGKEFAHRKSAKWHIRFDENDSLPNKSEGHLTSCYELTDADNLLYLYDKYYNGEDIDVEVEPVISDNPYIEPVYYHDDFIVTNSETGKNYAHNRIVFGAPGTGKSFKLDIEQRDLIRDGGEVERVTFHPDYSYAHFVGTYKPVPSATGISYEYVPGPFMRTYVNAIRNGRSEDKADVKPYLLLIEEINRANVAAVFGEVFQLLDRDTENKSQYAVKPSEDIKAYLAKELGGKAADYKELIIPDNMYIWSTMNSADQGVFPMDTAFKRRWNFEYIGINHNEDKIQDAYLVCGTGSSAYKVNWNELRTAINNTLSSKDYKINEDKLMGPFFVAASVIKDEEGFREVFKSKVIMYLFEDAAKQRRSDLFSGCNDDTKTKYSTICDDFDKRGIDIFCNAIKERVHKVAVKDTQAEGAGE